VQPRRYRLTPQAYAGASLDRFIRDREEAAFLVLARKASSVRKKESLAAWLYGVALRVAANLKRQSAGRRAHETPAGDLARRWSAIP
jgi:DNA-directed RNA polymerase specialized sigma24 family protein